MSLSDTSATAAPSSSTGDLEAAQAKITRLTRRLERERKAREEAEGIADRRMRELWLTNQDLDQRVAERTDDVKQAYDLLERSYGAASRFVSNLSHEMLTPLNGVMGMLELIEQHSHTDTLTTYVCTARQSTERLHQLVRRLLDLVQLSSGLLRANPTEFAAVDLHDAVERRWRVRCLQAQKLLTLSNTIDPDHTVLADFERLLQIIDEVLDNARLHADAGVLSVAFSVQPTAEGNDAFQVDITDAGPGFIPDETTGIFDTILHVDTAPGRASEGAGIGLGLAKELTRAIGGALTVCSAPGSRTKVSVVLPL